MNFFKKCYRFLLKPVYARLEEQGRATGEIAERLEEQSRTIGEIAERLEEQSRATGEIAERLEEQSRTTGKIAESLEAALCASRETARRAEQNSEQIDILKTTAAGIKEEINKILIQISGHTDQIAEGRVLIAAAGARAEALQKNMELLESQCAGFEKETEKYSAFGKRIENNEKDIVRVINTINRYHDNAYLNTMDYLQFENRFRGPREKVMKSQEQYVQYFRGKRNVLDIGCGRGEFLELLAAEQIPAAGVDLNETFVALCRDRGLKAVCGDAIRYIREMPGKADGIFCSQMAEHLSKAKLLELCRTCYSKMEEGAYIVFETPNASSLITLAQGFYIDPTHDRPVHYQLFQYFLEISGFRDIRIIFTEESKEGLPEIPHIEGGEGCRNAAEINEAITEVNRLLFSSQDYAIIARR